jgi:hypothetical protein
VTRLGDTAPVIEPSLIESSHATASSARWAGVSVALALLVVYGITLARGVTYWDAGEFLAAIHAYGIPHPPGTPVFVFVARVWSAILAPVLGFTIAVNAFSAFCTSAAFGLLATMFSRWMRDPLAAVAGAICAGTMSTVWLNATETEVYSAALLGGITLLWIANRAHDTGDVRWALLCAYGCGLAWALHLTALLTVPAALYLIFTRISARLRAYFAAAMLVVLGMSAVLFLLVRAWHDPAINQGNPSSIRALIDVVQRHQYEVAPLWPRRIPLWLQIGNLFEYADWQVALGLHQDPEPVLSRTLTTIVFACVGLYGCLAHRRRDRRSWIAIMILFVTTTLGVLLYLNLRAGPSYGYGVLPDGIQREARERDYFFTYGFVCWGLWAGMGLVLLGRALRDRIDRRTQGDRASPRAGTSRTTMWPVVIAILLATLPIALNWRAIRVERRDRQRDADRVARETLLGLPPRAIMLAEGDNDTYPLWYMQQVHGMRPDVTIVTIPLLGPTWYRQELARRYALLDASMLGPWLGTTVVLHNLRAHARAQGRPVVPSPIAAQLKAGTLSLPN